MPWLAVRIASVLGLGLGLVGPMEPPVGLVVFLLSLCPSEKAVIRLSLAHAAVYTGSGKLYTG